MKRIVLFLLLISVTVASPLSVFAQNDNNVIGKSESRTEYVYFDDGSYLVTTLVVETSLSANNLARGNVEKVGHKTAEMFNSSDKRLWRVQLTGKFLITDVSYDSGYCTSAKLTYTIDSSSWHISNIVEKAITNNACGSCTMKCKFLGITTQTANVDLTLTCDSYGNLS